MYNAKLAAQMRREQLLTMRSDKKVKAVNDMDVLNTTYKENKEWICAGCAIEIEPNKQSKCPNVFTGLTKKGKSLKDFLTSIIKENLDESMIGHKLCPSCYDALNHIEDLYASFRISADIFLDKFLLGQKALEADLVGLQQINDLTHLPGCLNLPLNKIVIKVCTTIFFQFIGMDHLDGHVGLKFDVVFLFKCDELAIALLRIGNSPSFFIIPKS